MRYVYKAFKMYCMLKFTKLKYVLHAWPNEILLTYFSQVPGGWRCSLPLVVWTFQFIFCDDITCMMYMYQDNVRMMVVKHIILIWKYILQLKAENISCMPLLSAPINGRSQCYPSLSNEYEHLRTQSIYNARKMLWMDGSCIIEFSLHLENKQQIMPNNV